MANQQQLNSPFPQQGGQSLIDEMFRQHRIYTSRLIEVAENLTRKTPHIDRASNYELMSVHMINLKKAEDILNKSAAAHQQEEPMVIG